MAIFKFCPKCGSRLALKPIDGHPVPVCTNKKCGFEFFQDSKPVAAGIILNARGEVLLVKRARAPHKGQWAMPGGFLHAGEHPEVGVKRELYEETGLRARIDRFIGIYVEHYTYKGHRFYSQNTYYLMHATGSTKIKLDLSENTHAKWFNIHTLPTLAFQNNRDAVRDYLNSRKK